MDSPTEEAPSSAVVEDLPPPPVTTDEPEAAINPPEPVVEENESASPTPITPEVATATVEQVEEQLVQTSIEDATEVTEEVVVVAAPTTTIESATVEDNTNATTTPSTTELAQEAVTTAEAAQPASSSSVVESTPPVVVTESTSPSDNTNNASSPKAASKPEHHGIGSPSEEVVDQRPSDIRFLTIKNLDTGEEFVIGENDPDFEFDTFEIGGTKESANKDGDGTAALTDANTEANKDHRQQRVSWLRSFFNYIYGPKESGGSVEDKIASTTAHEESSSGSHRSTQKTPFTKLSSFKFRKELGRGAFGRVLLAEAKTDGKLYALKIISKKNMRSSDKRQAKAERDILHAMTLKSPHPFTSGLKFAFQSENNLYLGMDFIPGGNLRELIKKFKYIPEDWVVFYAAELILAISHLHSLNVLYRDIKPHNVMIDAKGHLILIDFGLSKQEISHPRGALSLVGTPDYSAPEVLRTGVQQIEAHNREKALRAQQRGQQKKKKPSSSTSPNGAGNNANNGKKSEVCSTENRLSHIGYGKAADWWSLGIMIYEMISGKPTFRGADLRETYQKILYSKLEFVPEDRFSPEAKLLLEGLINRDPSLRLGAWENPPKDIMNSSFFRNIEWDAIYERRQDGPYVPELPSFMTNRRRNTDFGVSERDLSAAPIPENWKKVDFSPVPIERMTFVDPEKERVEAEAKKEKASKKRDESGDEDESDDNSMEESDESDEGEIAMRDSVFVTTDVNNQLADWSFIDEAVLMSYVTAAAEGKTGGKKKKSKKKDVIVEEEKESKMETIVEEVAEEATSEKEQPTPTPAAAPEQEETTPTNA